MRRHFAFFNQHDGSYSREWADDVPAPDVPAHVNGPVRLALIDQWTTHVSQPRPGEIGLDVTQYEYPYHSIGLGDFAWSTLDVVDRRLDFKTPHFWIEGDVVQRTLVANTQSPRQILSHGTRLLLDVTGTPLQAHHGQLFGGVSRDGDYLVFQLSGRSEPLRYLLPDPRTKTPAEVEGLRLLGG